MGQLKEDDLKNINLKTIRIDGNTQSRVALNESAVADYVEALKGGVELPPVVVFYDGADFWLADGFHRYHAYRQDGRASIPADVHEGTNREAILYAIGANQAHGLRRTNEDKRKAVSLMLADPEWAGWSDRNIAKHCGVTQPFVSGLRKPKVITVITPEQPKQPSKVESDSTPESGRVVTVTTQPEEFAPSEDEIREAEKSAADDAERVRLILESDDVVATLTAKCAQQSALIRVLEGRVGGLQNEVAEHVRSIKRLKAQLAKAGVAA